MEPVMPSPHPARRTWLNEALALAVVPWLPVPAGAAPGPSTAAGTAPQTRVIPRSGEALPLVGLGSWITFNVGNDRAARDASAEVMRAFFQAGGRLIDS